MDILRIEHVSKIYGEDVNRVTAVNDVSFTVPEGQFLAIIGPSGSGKSTLLHMMGGVDRPTSGKIFLKDRDIYDQTEDELAIFRRREVGLIYQFYNLIPVLNVEENLTLPVLMDGREVEKKRLREMLREIRLQETRREMPALAARLQRAWPSKWRYAMPRGVSSVISISQPSATRAPQTSASLSASPSCGRPRVRISIRPSSNICSGARS